MKALVFYVVALSGLACVRAQFSPVEGKDGSVPDSSVPKPDASSCPALDAKAGCDHQLASGASCDPVCQWGTCGDGLCGQKCSIAGDGTTTCSDPGTSIPGQSCTISHSDESTQSDECEGGSVCLPVPGELHPYCYKYCRTNQDCDGGTVCSPRVLSIQNNVKVWVCDPLYSKCDDLVPGSCCNPVTNTGCPDDALSGVHFYCHLVSPAPGGTDSRTVCEHGMGGGRKGASCVSSSACWQGWSCASGFCQQVCAVNDTSGTQCNGGACTPFGKQYGFCPAQ
jgi:hypothetical protein